MFGVVRKKSKHTRVVRAAASSSSDDDDDNVAVRVRELEQRRKEKAKTHAKKKTTTLLSFDPEDDDTNEHRKLSTHPKSSKRKSRTKSERSNKKQSGLGFGGVDAMSIDDEEESTPRNEYRGGSQYDLATLQKLRGEQKIATKRGNVDVPVVGLQFTDVHREEASAETMEEEFISLHSNYERVNTSHDHADDPIVLTGDDAMAFAEQENEDEYDVADFDQHGLFTPSAPPPTSIAKNVNRQSDNDYDEMMDEGHDQQWEDDVARRAGVLRPDAAAMDNDYNGGGRNNSSKRTHGSVSSLKQIRASLEPTITNLETVTSDLEMSISRHQSTLSTANDERTIHVISLEKHGKALEYYQGLRVDLATWLGALRELDGMVEKLEDAQHLLKAEITWTKIERRLEWAKDCTEVLEKVGFVKDKLTDGGDGADDVLANVSVRDEFGRDLTSLTSIERIRRWNQRRKRCLHRLQDSVLPNAEDVGKSLKHGAECINEDNVDVEENSEWKQRLDAIKQAIAIIPTLVKDDYLSVSNLCSLFFDWQRSYPDDYANCYAEMCIIRMIGVLARLELNEKWDVLNLKDLTLPPTAECLEITEFGWVRSLITLSDTSTETSRCKVILLEVVQKVFVGRLFDFFKIEHGAMAVAKRRGIYDPYSETQTICLTTMVKSIVALFTKYTQDDAIMVGKDMADKVLSALLSLLRYRVGNMLVPIIDSSKIFVTGNKITAIDGNTDLDGETSDAIAYATIVQAKEICTLVKNILGQWYPIFHRQLQPQQDSIAPLVKFVLADLVSLRLLPILLSLHDIKCSTNDESFSGLSKKFLGDVSCAIQGTGLFAAKEEWIFLSAPLRAAVNTILNND